MNRLPELLSSRFVIWSSFLRNAVRSSWFWLVVMGYMLRLLMMPLTGQHDVMFMPWMSRFINLGHLNLYSFLYESFGEVVMRSPAVWAPYPYGFYIFTSGWLGLLEKVGAVNLVAWNSIWQVSYPARYVFLFKLPYLFFDLLIGYILYRTSGQSGLALWAWSPAAIYTPFMMGQNDIYATALSVMGVYTASRSSRIALRTRSAPFPSLDRWAILSSVLLGLGATFKMFPLFLAPPLIIVTKKNWKSRLFLIGLSCLIFGIFALPFVTTPAYVEGVLLNPEGSEIFRSVDLFGVSVSPFLVSYVILLSFLITREDRLGSARGVWFAGLATMTLLFVWVPAPFYWLIWIAPLLIGVVDRNPRFLLAWLVMQLAFAFIPLAQHRELGAALPVHLSDAFNIPNLPTTLALTHPVLSRAFSAMWSLVNSLLIASLLLALWSAFCALGGESQKQSYSFGTVILGVVPLLLMISSLVANAYLARSLVSRNNYHSWESHTLTSVEDFLVQELNPPRSSVTGIRLRFTDASPDAVLKVCLYEGSDLSQEPVECISKRTSEQVENQVLYFIFDNVLLIEPQSTVAAKIQLETSGTMVELPYSNVNTERNLHFNCTTVKGTLDVSVLSQFSAREAFQDLVVENVLRDSCLMILIGVTGVLVFLSIGRLFSCVSDFDTF